MGDGDRGCPGVGDGRRRRTEEIWATAAVAQTNFWATAAVAQRFLAAVAQIGGATETSASPPPR
ncbi:UNVERIFIED_CONTAM: hypothetical protein Sradi_1337600 [Sesamum radiatum]|uniref:Uncharacterized protein n=1 Tax=Sesamum radiatum TaxID=300843 RepID=A0AAW2UPS4_SESRA